MNTTMKRPRGTSAEEQTILDRFATRTRRVRSPQHRGTQPGRLLPLWTFVPTATWQ